MIIFVFMIFTDSLLTVNQSTIFVNSAFTCIEFGFVCFIAIEINIIAILYIRLVE